jgi:endonuclease YncB( thermonuclease family)
MINKINLARIILILFCFLLFYPAISAAGQFKVVRVYDGDTLKAVGHDIEIKIRLVGIDAPETKKGKRKPGQPYSQQAKKFLMSIVLNKIVDIKGYGLGPYNRVLSVVYFDGKNVNLELVKAGIAEAYRGKQPKGFDITPYRLAEAEAKKAGRGMWSIGNKYVSPKDWRKMHRK